jgi:hypothetical protein
VADVLRKGRMAQAAEAVRSPSPRVKMAARLYATGAAPTKKAAAEAAGIHPAWFTLLTNHNEETKRLVDSVDAKIEDQSVDMSTVLRTVGREAIKRIRQLMIASARDDIALKAAQDLADRNPETSKIQRHEVASVHMGPDEARELAAALVEGARVRERYAKAVEGDFVTVEDAGNGSQPQNRNLAPAPPGAPTQSGTAAREGQVEVGDQTPQTAERT